MSLRGQILFFAFMLTCVLRGYFTAPGWRRETLEDLGLILGAVFVVYSWRLLWGIFRSDPAFMGDGKADSAKSTAKH